VVGTFDGLDYGGQALTSGYRGGMKVALRGSSAAAVTAGILLMSRARRLGQRVDVQIVGDPDDIAVVSGPALVHSAVLAGCGVGRALGSGALVIVSGPPSEPLAMSLSKGGTHGWFTVDRSGHGLHPATQAFVRLCHDSKTEARNLGRQLRRALDALGCPPEPAMLDLLFSAPVSPLERLSLGLRAGRAMTGSSSMPLTRYLRSSMDDLPDPLPSPCSAADFARARVDGRLDKLLCRVRIGVRDSLDDWLKGVGGLPCEDGMDMTALMCALAEVGSHLLILPHSGLLPPLDAAMDGVAVGLGAALGATSGESNANAALVDMFCFLGGSFVSEARFAIEIAAAPPPEGRLERWRWLCESVEVAASTADRLWRQVIDPPQ
jgi:hypothetical protein